MDWRQVRAIYFSAVAQIDGAAGPDAPRLALGRAARPFLDQLLVERGAAYGLDPGRAAETDGRRLAELLGAEGEAFLAQLLGRRAARARRPVREAAVLESARHPYTRWLVRRAVERPGESLRADMVMRQHELDPPQLETVLAAMKALDGGGDILAARPRRSIAIQAFHAMLADTLGGRPHADAMLRRVLRAPPVSLPS